MQYDLCIAQRTIKARKIGTNIRFVLNFKWCGEITITLEDVEYTSLYRGKRHYELSNHLGNVQVVVSDKRISVCDTELEVEYFKAEVLSAVDCYPFGMMMPDRQWYAGSDSGNYRFGFNGQEKDNEVSGLGNSNTAEYWQYDSRLGRRWNVDPVVKEWESPYLTYSGNPIFFIDPSGASASPIIDVGTGELLGADDQGMQGEAIFMRSDQFEQGMSHDKALEVGVSPGDFKEVASTGILQRAEEVISTLPSRPDWDGYLSFDEAREWYRNGNGQPLYIDVSQINLGKFNQTELPFGNPTAVNYDLTHISNLTTGLVYGTLTLTNIGYSPMLNTITVKLGGTNGKIDTYNFNMDGRTVRDILTWYGGAVSAHGGWTNVIPNPQSPSPLPLYTITTEKQFDIYGYGVQNVDVKSMLNYGGYRGYR